jgi:hypothetical protein
MMRKYAVGTAVAIAFLVEHAWAIMVPGARFALIAFAFEVILA